MKRRLAVLVLIAFAAGFACHAGYLRISRLLRDLQIHTKADPDKFRLTILETQSVGSSFTARLRLSSDASADAGIWLVDLQRAPFVDAIDSAGERYYREQNLHRVGQSQLIPGGEAEIQIRLTARGSNTLWFSQINDRTVSTTVPIPFSISSIRTNSVGQYETGSSVPLAKLGPYVIVVSMK